MSSFTKQELTDDIDSIIAANESQENGVLNSLSTQEDESIYECVQNYAKYKELEAIQTESTAEIAHAFWIRSDYRNMDYKDFITVHGQEIFGPTLKRAIDNLYANWAFLLNSDNMESWIKETNGFTGRTFSTKKPLSKYTLKEAKEKVKGLLDREDFIALNRFKYRLTDLTKPWKLESILYYDDEKKGISFFSKIYFLLR
jgi:hypothetical protein